MTEASGGGEEPNGCFEGWEGVLLAWRVKGRRREQGLGGKEEPVVDMGLLQGRGALEHPHHPSVLFASIVPAWLPYMSPHPHNPE